MSKYIVIQTYKMQDIWKNVEAKDKQEAIDICIGGLPVNENKPNYTNDIFEVSEYTYLNIMKDKQVEAEEVKNE